MKSFVQTVVALRKKDYTLPEIVKATGRPKTSVYHHIRNLPLSPKKLRAIKYASKILALGLALKRRGVSRKKFRTFTNWTPELVFLVAHLLFDGELKRTGPVYNNRNLVLIGRVRKLMRRIYRYPDNKYYNALTGVHRISYFNVSLGEYLQTKGVELVQKIETLPLQCRINFLRAFFDDEGCIDFRIGKGLRRIRGYQKDVARLILVQRLLSQIGVDAVIRKPNEVVILRKENLLKFQKLVGFSKGVRINGKRSNSIWKKSLEKRVLLRRAIASFKN